MIVAKFLILLSLMYVILFYEHKDRLLVLENVVLVDNHHVLCHI